MPPIPPQEDAVINATVIAASVGAVAAVVGTLISSFITMISAHGSRAHERDVRQRERLERMSDLIGTTLDWFQKVGNCKSLEDIALSAPPIQARQAAMLARLYFPRVAEAAEDYLNSLLAYHGLVVDCFQPDLPMSSGAQMVKVLQQNPELKRIFDAPLIHRNRIDTLLAKEAKRYAHA